LIRKWFYIFTIISPQPLLASLALGVAISLVVLTDSNLPDSSLRFQVSARYFAWGAAFLASILIAYGFRPEDGADVEMRACLPTPFMRQVAEQILACLFAVILPVALVFLLHTAFLGQATAEKLGLGLVAFFTNAVLLGGIAIAGTVFARQSGAGAALALGVLIVATFIPVPEVIRAAFLFGVAEGLTEPLVWWMSRAVYLLIGSVAFGLGMQKLKDTDYLLVGKRPAAIRLRSADRQTSKPGSTSERAAAPFTLAVPVFLNRPLEVPSNHVLWGAAYETLRLTISGWLPIAIIAMCWVFTIPSLINGSFNLPYALTIDVPRSILMLSLIMLPPLVCDAIPSDRRSHLDQMLLAIVSHEAYLAIKVLGTVTAALGAVLIGMLPIIAFLGGLALLNAAPQFLAAHIAIWLLAIIPGISYLCSMSVLLGSLAGTRPAFGVGGIIALVNAIVFAVTTNSIVGNMIFPGGNMALETIGAWLREPISITHSYLIPPPVVPWYMLGIPLISSVCQVMLAWHLALQVFRRRGRRE